MELKEEIGNANKNANQKIVMEWYAEPCYRSLKLVMMDGIRLQIVAMTSVVGDIIKTVSNVETRILETRIIYNYYYLKARSQHIQIFLIVKMVAFCQENNTNIGKASKKCLRIQHTH